MKAIEKILKININGELVKYNSRLGRWESVSSSWSWGDIHTDYLQESNENWEYYQEQLKQD